MTKQEINVFSCNREKSGNEDSNRNQKIAATLAYHFDGHSTIHIDKSIKQIS